MVDDRRGVFATAVVPIVRLSAIQLYLYDVRTKRICCAFFSPPLKTACVPLAAISCKYYMHTHQMHIQGYTPILFLARPWSMYVRKYQNKIIIMLSAAAAAGLLYIIIIICIASARANLSHFLRFFFPHLLF